MLDQIKCNFLWASFAYLYFLRPCKRRNFWTFCFREFRNISVIEIRKFFGNISFFELAKILWKKFGNKFGNENSEINLNIIQICTSNTKLSNKNTQKFSRLWKIENSKFSEHYKKMTLKSNFENHKKLFPTRTFKFKFRMQGLNIFVIEWTRTGYRLWHHFRLVLRWDLNPRSKALHSVIVIGFLIKIWIESIILQLLICNFNAKFLIHSKLLKLAVLC